MFSKSVVFISHIQYVFGREPADSICKKEAKLER